MAVKPDVVISQIDTVLAAAGSTIQGKEHAFDHDVARHATAMMACIERTTPVGSAYRVNAEKIMQFTSHINYTMLAPLSGVLTAIREDYRADRLRSIEELIHADLFSDFVEMARHLNSEGHGYKDAAAVIIGSTLEGHLRQLCAKHGVATQEADGTPLKATRLNADLRKATAYEKGDEKQVTAWLDLRNDAAHGHYGKYTKEQVALMIDGVADFMRRVPA